MVIFSFHLNIYPLGSQEAIQNFRTTCHDYQAGESAVKHVFKGHNRIV